MELKQEAAGMLSPVQVVARVQPHNPRHVTPDVGMEEQLPQEGPAHAKKATRDLVVQVKHIETWGNGQIAQKLVAEAPDQDHVMDRGVLADIVKNATPILVMMAVVLVS